MKLNKEITEELWQVLAFLSATKNKDFLLRQPSIDSAKVEANEQREEDGAILGDILRGEDAWVLPHMCALCTARWGFFCQLRFRSFTVADRCASPFVRTTVAEPTLRFAAALCVTAFLQATTAAGRPRDDWLACELTVRTTTERHPAADESAVQATRSTTFNRLMLRWPKLMWIGGGFSFTGKRVEGDQMIGARVLRKRLKWKRSGLRSACVRALLRACAW
jgi:hypothetical protein